MRGMCAHLGFLFQVSDFKAPFRPETADVVWAARLKKSDKTLRIRQRLEKKKKAVNPEQNFELETSSGILGGCGVL